MGDCMDSDLLYSDSLTARVTFLGRFALRSFAGFPVTLTYYYIKKA